MVALLSKALNKLTICSARVRQLVSTISVPLPLPAKATSQEVHTYVILPIIYCQRPDAIFSLSKEAQVAQSPDIVSSTSVTSSIAVNHDAALAAASAASTSPPLFESDKLQPVMDSTTAPLQGTSQRVKRKRKTLDYLIDVDQKKFRLGSMQSKNESSGLNEVCYYILEPPA